MRKIPVAIYTRKSVTLKKGDTLEVQRKKCETQARADLEDEGVELEFYLFSDQKTGSNMEREGFQELLRGIRQNKFKYLYVYKLDRIGRTTVEVLNFVEELEKRGVELICVEDKITTMNGTGKLMMTLFAVVAEMERANIIERVVAAYEEQARQGVWLGGNAPLGFTSSYVENKGLISSAAKKISMLQEIEDEKKIVKFIFTTYTSSEIMSLPELSKRIKNMGYVTRGGKAIYDQHTLSDILKNPVYVQATEEVYDYYIEQGVSESNISNRDRFDGIHGIFINNKTTRSKNKILEMVKSQQDSMVNEAIRELDVDELPETVRLSPSEWIVAVAPHKGFIDAATWLEAQQRLNGRRNKRTKLYPKNKNVLFSGDTFRCAKCGSIISYFNRPSKADPQILYPVYRCEGKRKSNGGICDVPNINAVELDKKMVDILFTLKEKYVKDRKYLDVLKKDFKIVSNVCTQEDLNKKIGKEQESINNLVKNMGKAELDKDTVEFIYAEINKHKDNIKELKIKLQEEQEKETERQEQFKALDLLPDKLLTMSRDMFDALPMSQKQYIVNIVFSSLSWDGENVEVHFHAEKELEKAG